MKRENAEGHYVGMHSMTHNFAKLYKNGEYVNEMKEDQLNRQYYWEIT